ncbi:MAG: hypothetical protein HYR88_08130 [Verrucomicrobia bacterium]|nr:hypothetical protein [Verrucomicrobiota bacterium]MBI3868451.1 hypothetical protein [Verrucomicrobiota bacterium]
MCRRLNVPLAGARLLFTLLLAPHCLLPSRAAELPTPDSVPLHKEENLARLMPVWNPLYSLSVGAGYKDNLLLASRGKESSGFVGFAGDFTLWRRPDDDGKELQFGLSANDRRYWADRNMDHENSLITYGRYIHDLSPHWQWVSEFSAGYFDQVFDFTSLETQVKRRRLRQITLGGSMGLRRKIHEQSWVQFSPIASRSWFHDEFDHYSEYGGVLTFNSEYGRRSEWNIEYSGRARVYDSSMQATLQGVTIPGTSLVYARHALQFADKHYFDPAHRWMLETKARGLVSFDNGSGYFNYWRIGFSERLQVHLLNWEFKLETGLTYYEFPHQGVGGAGRDRRTRCDLVEILRVERTVGHGWKLYGEYDHDRSLASDPFERFGANTVSGGVIWEF